MNLLHANDRPVKFPPSWYAATAEAPAPFPELRGATRADVCVVGGGYTGLSTALHLAERGYDVALIVPGLNQHPELGCAVGRTGRVFFDARPLDWLRGIFG